MEVEIVGFPLDDAWMVRQKYKRSIVLNDIIIQIHGVQENFLTRTT